MRRKEEKIRQAQWEKEQKELKECSFSPAINRRKPQRSSKSSFVPTAPTSNARREPGYRANEQPEAYGEEGAQEEEYRH